jgi:hypothetical protein
MTVKLWQALCRYGRGFGRVAISGDIDQKLINKTTNFREVAFDVSRKPAQMEGIMDICLSIIFSTSAVQL